MLRKLARSLKPGGLLFIRDYGRYDEAQLRFKKGSKLDDHFYVRQDGTCAYYFDLEELVALAESLKDDDDTHMEKIQDESNSGSSSGSGVLFRREALECFYIHRQYANRAQARARRRVWIQVKLVKL